MVRKSNKEIIEEYYFTKFSKVYPLPPGDIKYTDRPDIIIEGEKRIGIEITNFFHEDGKLLVSEQTQRVLREKTVFNAQQLYRNDNGRNIGIAFGFDKANPIRDRKKLEKKLADLAKHIEDIGSGEIFRDTFKTIPELTFVYLNANENEDAKWRVQQVHDGQVMLWDRLLKIVREKEKKVGGYINCDAYWLLVVIDFFDRAQDQEVPRDGFEKIETEIFEKVIVYKTVYEDILEMK